MNENKLSKERSRYKFDINEDPVGISREDWLDYSEKELYDLLREVEESDSEFNQRWTEILERHIDIKVIARSLENDETGKLFYTDPSPRGKPLQEEVSLEYLNLFNWDALAGLIDMLNSKINNSENDTANLKKWLKLTELLKEHREQNKAIGLVNLQRAGLN